MSTKQHYEIKGSDLLQMQIKIAMDVYPQECMVIRLFSRLKEEQLEAPAELLAARKNAFLQHVAALRDSRQFSQLTGLKNRT